MQTNEEKALTAFGWFLVGFFWAMFLIASWAILRAVA